MKDRYGVPEIFEAEATGALKELYTDIKYVLKVPIVNFIFRTLALYEPFLTFAWQQARPNCLTYEFIHAADTLTHPPINLEVPSINWSTYYNDKGIHLIKGILEVFSIVNPKLLIIASAWSEALANRPNQGTNNVTGVLETGVPSNLPPIKLVQVPDAPESTRQLMLDIAQKHQAYDVASDFRALAHFPHFLGYSWSHLRPYVGSDSYNVLTAYLKTKAIEATKQLPYPVTINRFDLEQIYSPQDIAGIMGLVNMYQNFIPGLIIDIEYFQHMIYLNEQGKN